MPGCGAAAMCWVTAADSSSLPHAKPSSTRGLCGMWMQQGGVEGPELRQGDVELQGRSLSCQVEDGAVSLVFWAMLTPGYHEVPKDIEGQWKWDFLTFRKPNQPVA